MMVGTVAVVPDRGREDEADVTVSTWSACVDSSEYGLLMAGLGKLSCTCTVELEDSVVRSRVVISEEKGSSAQPSIGYLSYASRGQGNWTSLFNWR
jgi:hypothetical protein